ncbi:diacylglycerol kinase family protein [Patescibacteria group bacterium]
MKKILKSHHPKRHAKSFKFAFDGLLHTLLNEPNFRVQLVIAAAVVYFGFKFSISYIEWGLLTISLGLLLSAEMINTVVENFIDELIKIESERAKIIKDVSAGFVLISAIIAFILILLIFWEHVFQFFI